MTDEGETYMNEDAKVKTMEYVSKAGYKGILYNLHYDESTGEWNYSLSVKDKDGYEVLHAYNASPKTMEELKNATIHWGTFLIREMARRYESEKGDM